LQRKKIATNVRSGQAREKANLDSSIKLIADASTFRTKLDSRPKVVSVVLILSEWERKMLGCDFTNYI